MRRQIPPASRFQHTAARRRLQGAWIVPVSLSRFNTQPPEGGCANGGGARPGDGVSTHSRPKAAARRSLTLPRAGRFQHTAARRRLPAGRAVPGAAVGFQHTAARRRLRPTNTTPKPTPGFNTQPPEGGCARRPGQRRPRAGFNTQPPEGGCLRERLDTAWGWSFNTQPPEGGCNGWRPYPSTIQSFQHTAARRRLLQRLRSAT